MGEDLRWRDALAEEPNEGGDYLVTSDGRYIGVDQWLPAPCEETIGIWKHGGVGFWRPLPLNQRGQPFKG